MPDVYGEVLTRCGWWTRVFTDADGPQDRQYPATVAAEQWCERQKALDGDRITDMRVRVKPSYTRCAPPACTPIEIRGPHADRRPGLPVDRR